MAGSLSDGIQVEPVPLPHLMEVLRLLGFDAAHRERMLDDVRRGALEMHGLFQARRGGQLVGAAWGQIVPGRTAFCWTPCLVDGESDVAAASLLAAVDNYLDDQDVVLVQAVLPVTAHVDAERLTRAGYRDLAVLLYMADSREGFPQREPTTELEFRPLEACDETRLERLIERTYRSTLDCEELNGLRSMSDILRGYRQTGCYRPDWWFTLRHAGADVGCVLLADHPDHDQAELMYLGLTPESRGRGWGTQATQYVQWLVGTVPRRRIVLAVDQQNWPALNVYLRAGFLVWDERRVYVRTPRCVD